MTSCPQPTHQGSSSLTLGPLIIDYCREGCSRTFFVCERCHEANRSLARFCRQCGEPILYERSETKQNLTRPLSEGRSQSFKLSEYGVNEVQELKVHKGFLIVVADRSVLIYDVHKLYEPLYQFRPADERIVRGVTVISNDDDELLLVTTSRSVYKISLLALKAEDKPVYEATAGRYLTHPVQKCAGNYYVLDVDENMKSSRLVSLSEGEVFSFEGSGRFLHSLRGQQLFFCTEMQMFIYFEREILEKRLPEPLGDATPACSEDSGMIYLVGVTGLWRVVLSNGELTIVSLPTTRILGAPRLTASQDRVFVAHSQGFIVLDPFGGVQWDSTYQHIRAESDGHNPQAFETFVLFTALGQTGGSKLRAHALNDLNDYKTLDYEHRLLCPPLLTIGRIVSATGVAGNALLSYAT
jgi:hypothetical protein